MNKNYHRIVFGTIKVANTVEDGIILFNCNVKLFILLKLQSLSSKIIRDKTRSYHLLNGYSVAVFGDPCNLHIYSVNEVINLYFRLCGHRLM